MTDSEKSQRLELADGTTLAYAHSAGAAPGVVFCPGFNSDMQGTKALALRDWCAKQRRQYTRFDYFGHGRSDGQHVDGTIGRWLDDTVAILDRVASGPQVLVGSSMGGWIMLLAALQRPERVAGLVGIAAAPDFTRRMRDVELSAAQLADLERSGFCDLPNEYEGGTLRISRQLLDEGERHLLLQRELPLDCPVRLLHGQRDEDVPWQTALQIAESVRSEDVEIQLVKAGDHRLSGPGDIARLTATLSALTNSIGAG